jgi:hypothetical protein
MMQRKILAAAANAIENSPTRKAALRSTQSLYKSPRSNLEGYRKGSSHKEGDKIIIPAVIALIQYPRCLS